jgi:hypothetical protein
MKLIFSDFDGTLTNDGKLGAIFFDILKHIESANSELVIVSGRSLSWGHFFLTHFNLNFCIMEGGGVIVFKDEQGKLCEKDLISQEEIIHLDELTKKLCKEVPGVVMSLDSFGRRTDRAVEFMEMQEADIMAMKSFFNDHNINYSQSNVHINFWVGDISKAYGVQKFLNKFHSKTKHEETLFFGDAANDESMFKFFPNTVGVSNISEIIDELEFKPKTILRGAENEGALGVYNYLKENL